MESAGKMPKRNSQSVKKTAEKTVEQTAVETVSVPKPEYTFTTLEALIDATIYVTGMYSGREYVFAGGGSVQNVDDRDVQWMLEKRQGERQCCGGTDRGNQVFRVLV